MGKDACIDDVGLGELSGALGKSRTWRALTTTAGKSAASKAPTAASGKGLSTRRHALGHEGSSPGHELFDAGRVLSKRFWTPAGRA